MSNAPSTRQNPEGLISQAFNQLRTFEVQLPQKLIFGVGTAAKVGAEAKTIGTKSVLLVTDPIISKLPTKETIRGSLENEGIKTTVYDDVEPEPTLPSLERLLKAVGHNGDYDLLVALGGGSPMDSAKAASILSKNPGPPEDYFVGAKKRFTRPGIPVIAIPTTAGTGSEVSGAAVVKTREEEIKAFYDHLWMRPVVAIVDPLMSATMPQKLTASTGMDALSHAVESSLTNAANLMTRTFAMKSIQLITNNLRLAVHQADNIAARYNMALAASIGSLSETNAGDLEGHAIAHLLGSILKLPHGLCCAVMLPYVMEYNRLVSPEILRDIAQAMGEDVGTLSTMDAARKASRAVKSLVEDVGLPSNIRELGVKEGDLSTLADQSLTIPWIKFFFERRSIRKATKESVLKLLQNAWKGQLE